MNDDNRLKTAAMLSELWDGKAVKRVRAGDGVTILPGRRLALHIMIQPDAAAEFLCNDQLRDQGLLSRVLVAAPPSMAGTRFYRNPHPNDQAAINAYGARLLSILEAEPLLEPGKRNERAPKDLPMSADAAALWRGFYDHVEGQCGAESPLAPIRDFAAKAAEHVARIAGVLTIVEDLQAREVGVEAMRCAILLGDGTSTKLAACTKRGGPILAWFELRRSSLGFKVSQKMKLRFVTFSTEDQNATRTKKAADEALDILAAHGWISEASNRPRIVKVMPKKGAGL
jgi:hypothetical protein